MAKRRRKGKCLTPGQGFLRQLVIGVTGWEGFPNRLIPEAYER